MSQADSKLVNLMATTDQKTTIDAEISHYRSLTLTDRQLCDLELLLNGGFSPLKGFLNQADYEHVVTNMRLADGTIWPMPVVLDVSQAFADQLAVDETIALRDQEGIALAVLRVNEHYRPDLEYEANQVYGSNDNAHPGVAYLQTQQQPVNLSGSLTGLQLPVHYDFNEFRHTPAELRNSFTKRGWEKVVAFQTRNPMHRAHIELVQQAARQTGANVLIHPVVGLTKPGDIDHYTRVRAYKAVLRRFAGSTSTLSLLPLAMRMGGPREAVWHALIRRNYGASHFIVGRDHAGPGKDSSGTDFYAPYAAQELVEKYADEIGVQVVPFKQMVYLPGSDSYLPIDDVPAGTESLSLSGTELRERLRAGKSLPEWFTYPEVAQELFYTSPPRAKQGFTVCMTGLSSSGKSTIANALLMKLLELGGRRVTLLDGDVVRTNLSSELGFSREHRDINIRRIGYVASEISKHGGIAICAPIAPYALARDDARRAVEQAGGGFVLCYVNTPLKICEQRDRKGLYKKARAGLLPEFTGISDPYETPDNADLVLTTTEHTVDELAQQIILYLEQQGFIAVTTS